MKIKMMSEQPKIYLGNQKFSPSCALQPGLCKNTLAASQHTATEFRAARAVHYIHIMFVFQMLSPAHNELDIISNPEQPLHHFQRKIAMLMLNLTDNRVKNSRLYMKL
uniref:Uncharacterized protein n=1 Tax=Romanomermis culicivorax TaxID=13658 RepID=A0A915JM52_ROMCU